MAPSPPRAIDTEDLGFDRGAHLLVKRALAAAAPGTGVAVRGRHPDLGVHLRAWARAHGQVVTDGAGGGFEVRSGPSGPAVVAGGDGVAVAGGADPASGVVEHPPAYWGLAARGARVEVGAPDIRFRLDRRAVVWADEAPRLYAQAAAQQWDPATAVDWDAGRRSPPDPEIEAAVVQVMTYLIENENAALVVPARFLGQVHPHFREVVQLLAVQVADEARHVEVFTRRALLHGGPLGLSTAGGQASLKTLLDEPDFALASFLLSVLGEGSFLSLLGFLADHAPDPVTRQVARLAAQDEARHVAFGLAHLGHQVSIEPDLRERLAAAVVSRHDALASTAGLNEEVFDALVVLAAGGFSPVEVGQGWDRVAALQREMDTGRRRRLRRLGFSASDAGALSALHTRNFM